MGENYVENIFYGFLVQEDFTEAWTYLNETKQKQKAASLLHNLQKPISFQTEHTWLNQCLEAYYEYLQASFIKKFKLPFLTTTDKKEGLVDRLREILQLPNGSMEELEEKVQQKLKKIGWYAKLGKSGHYYAPYIWKKENVQSYEVQMPHSVETIKVHFISDFLTKGWLSFISDDLFSVGAWVEDGEIYCVKEVYGEDLSLPKFQISLLKHETQHLIDSYLHLDATKREYRGKLVELYYYPDVSFLSFVLKGADFLSENQQEAKAFAFILKDLENYLQEVGIERPREYLQSCLKSPLEWVKKRGTIQQAALAILDRDTQKILQEI